MCIWCYSSLKRQEMLEPSRSACTRDAALRAVHADQHRSPALSAVDQGVHHRPRPSASFSARACHCWTLEVSLHWSSADTMLEESNRTILMKRVMFCFLSSTPFQLGCAWRTYHLVSRWRFPACGSCVRSQPQTQLRGASRAATLWKMPRSPTEPMALCLRLGAPRRCVGQYRDQGLQEGAMARPVVFIRRTRFCGYLDQCCFSVAVQSYGSQSNGVEATTEFARLSRSQRCNQNETVCNTVASQNACYPLVAVVDN